MNGPGVPTVGDDVQLRAWQDHAACAEMSLNLFFHPEYERANNRARRVAQAQAVCAPCPVAAHCREFALQNGENYGTWGGLDELERRAVRRARQNAP